MMSEATLSYEVIGSGRHVAVYCHGLPSAKAFARLHQRALEASEFRLIGIDRPGYGDSPPSVGLDLAEDARRIIALLDSQGVRDFAVIGVSCGGPTAAAVAALARGRCRFLGLVAAMPPGACVGDPRARRQLAVFRHVFNSARKNGMLAKLFFRLDGFLIRRNAEKALASIESLLDDADRAVLGEKAFRQTFLDSLRQAYKNGHRGALADARKVASASPDYLRNIECRGVYYRAGRDRHVTREMSAVYSGLMPRLLVRDYAGAGHVSIVRDAEADLFRDLALEMGAAP